MNFTRFPSLARQVNGANLRRKQKRRGLLRAVSVSMTKKNYST
jgi:hypothetical protein